MLSTLAADALTPAEAWRAAIAAAQNNDFRKAVERADEAERLGLTDAELFYYRGRWNFRAGEIQASLKDFDRYIAAMPQRANSQWERGITCYYARAFKAGAKQFEDYQTFHDNDVENAVWRYLCQVKFDAKAKALAAMLPIKNDTRVPMMEIYELFRGKSQPEKVLEVVKASKSPERVLRQQRFDAHLYLALFLYAEDDFPAARRHIDLAVKQYEHGDYMWAVAVQHQKLMRAEQKQRGRKPKAEKKP